MKSRTFNNYASKIHETWASNLLGIPVNLEDGIDLIDSKRKLGVEVKFAMDYQGWTVLDWQLDYGKKLDQAYWALGIYSLNQPISSIRTTNLSKIEKMINRRDLWLVSWDWMNQFPIHKTAGKSEFTEWKLNLVYPKHRLLPKTVKSIPIKNGTLNVTEGVDYSVFDIEKAA